MAGLDNGRGGFLTHAAPDLGFGARPEWRYWLDVVEALGLPAPEAAPAFPISAADQAAADALLAALPRAGGPLVAIHAGVGGYAPIKQWPVERFATVGRRLVEATGATALVVGGPEMTALGAALTRQIGPGAIDLVGRTSLPVLAGLLRRCDLMLGNESGVAHLASAVGCRTLALFGPTNAAAWAPYGARVLTLPRDDGAPTGVIVAGERGVALRVDEPVLAVLLRRLRGQGARSVPAPQLPGPSPTGRRRRRRARSARRAMKPRSATPVHAAEGDEVWSDRVGSSGSS